MDELLSVAQDSPGNQGFFGRCWATVKRATVYLLKNHGFVGVLLLASWPNAAFDMAGMACGAFLMDFWTFFGATLIGKALIKVHGQLFLFLYLFLPHTRHLFVEYWKVAFASLQTPLAPLVDTLGVPQPKEWGAMLETQLNSYIAKLKDPVIDTRWFWQRWADEGTFCAHPERKSVARESCWCDWS